MEFKDLLSLYFERSNAMQVYWNFYITIILALIAFFATIKVSSRTKSIAVILTTAFTTFAIVNLNALREVDQQRIDAKSLIQSSSFKKDSAPAQHIVSGLLAHLNPPTIAWLTVTHIVGDAVVVVAILLLGWRKRNPVDD